MAAPEALDVFLSYPAAPSARAPDDVLALTELLSDFGLRTSQPDSLRLPAGPTREEEIMAALEQAPIFIACATPNPPSAWGGTELARAAAGNDRGLAVVLLPNSSLDAVDAISARLRRPEVFDLREGLNLDRAADLVSWCWRRIFPAHSSVLEDVVGSLESGSNLAVLTGPSGSGKSKLARLVSARLADSFSLRTAVRLKPEEPIERGLERAILGALNGEGDAAPVDSTTFEGLTSGGGVLARFDEIDLDDVTPFALPHPSAALIVSRRRPTMLPPDGHVFSLREPFRSKPPGPEPIPRELLAGYRSDVPGSQDLLEIESSVNALCSVIASRQVLPPLSIGLFGRWGAGKSFFIENMQRRIAALAAASQVQPEESDYCPTIHQITFNAWHYADSNLWASLASEIFGGLADSENELDGLIAALDSSRLQLEDADSNREAALLHLERAKDDQRSAHDASVGIHLELKDLATSAATALDDDEQARELLSFGGMVRDLWHGSEVLISVLVFVLIAGVAIAFLLPDLYTMIGGIALALFSVVGLIAGPIRVVNQAATAARRRASESQQRRETELEVELERLRDAEREAVQRQAEARREMEEAARAISDIENGKRLYRFIEEQSRAEAYGPYLGLVALVRKDFDRLAELTVQHEEATADGRGPRRRIVLYIDDLDRCPAGRVVEVLEAAHLLMASPLFVVIVAVDARWLVTSLSSHYAVEMVNGAGTPTPHDYLEKIFQIPFSLPEMDDSGFRRLVQDLLPQSEKHTGDDTLQGGGGTLGRQALGNLRLGAAPSGNMSTAQVEQTDPERSANPNLTPEGLVITTAEVEFMAGLGSLIRTPRATKRLTNLYRLVRVSLSHDQLRALTEEPNPRFPCVQLLLAIAVGFPSLAPYLFMQAAVAAQDSGQTWWEVIDRLAPPRGMGEPWEELRRALRAQKARPYPAALGDFATWVPIVARYTYGLQLLTMAEADTPQ
jgi:hypothetical protein